MTTSTQSRDLRFVSVFTDGVGGGNPCPVLLDADGMTADEMKALSAVYGYEAAFVCSPTTPGALIRLRYFVPAHEMEMCGHATLGTMWLLRQTGVWDTESAVVQTLSGPVEVRYTSSGILVSQDRGVVEDVSDPTLLDRIHALLSLGPGPLEGVTNASTSRVKTLIPTCIEQLQAIDAAKLDADQVRQLCDDLGSTGLYPFAVESRSPLRLHARQFPRSSGYTEDAATGIAAAAALYGALHLGLVSDQNGVTVRQGYAMGRPSAIAVELRTPGKPEDGCWISGEVELTTLEPLARDH